jgi:hypothetical protein
LDSKDRGSLTANRLSGKKLHGRSGCTGFPARFAVYAAGQTLGTNKDQPGSLLDSKIANRHSGLQDSYRAQDSKQSMAASTQKTSVNRRPLAPAANWAPRNADPRTPLGTRISEAIHRQLKLASAFSGIAVQDLVEQAIQEFLTKHPELHPSLGPSRSTKSTPRKQR